MCYEWQYSPSVQQGYEGVKIKPSGAGRHKNALMCQAAAQWQAWHKNRLATAVVACRKKSGTEVS
ncbi:MAG TPA: hypothetical protein IAC72_02975 [Candidatus Fimimonas merdipullorum]|uniref:Uncharacterized protein n=1 Tax=Candidatus Fimimonas merdipullorum TaxID=2840822 RepID=A0A9D1MWV3_9BACT|nr:hypothetical protein [Candidatus Fimimonas merdipullorum]